MQNLNCKGHELQGDGFKLTEQEAKRLITSDERNRKVIFQLLTGDELNNAVNSRPSEWVINFGTRSQKEAESYPLPFEIVEQNVKPHRLKYQGSTGRDKALRSNWWLFRGHRQEIDDYAANHQRFIARSVVSKYSVFNFVDANCICTASIYCFLMDDFGSFSQLQSTFHDVWSRKYGSTLRTDLRYVAGRCFATYPMISSADLDQIGQIYYEHRLKVCREATEGLTMTYNRFHDRSETSEDIARLRALHSEMDLAVAAAYGWHDLELEHGFYETEQGLRYTISKSVRHAILERLLSLNHQRYAEEQAENLTQAISAPVKRERKRNRKADKVTLDLL